MTIFESILQGLRGQVTVGLPNTLALAAAVIITLAKRQQLGRRVSSLAASGFGLLMILRVTESVVVQLVKDWVKEDLSGRLWVYSAVGLPLSGVQVVAYALIVTAIYVNRQQGHARSPAPPPLPVPPAP